MFLLHRPSKAEIDEFLNARKADTFSYPEVGAMLGSPPTGYNIDHNRAILGQGADVFELAKKAVREWKMFDVPGLELFYSDTPIERGRDVAPLAHHLGFYSLNSCRIAYVIDEANTFGFAYGTLTEHVEIGEERFKVELDPESGEVWYDILAFSRPGHLLVKLGYPYSRYKQKQFAVGSKAAMLRAVGQVFSEAGASPPS
jgi:uncharacterized protein (UPF0548 family)